MIRHFTATTFIVDSQNRTLLLWHKKQKRWMPPGGHMDPNELPEETAKRECKEETGLDVEIISDPQEDIFALNSHEGAMLIKPTALLLENIAACEEYNEQAHQHMDFVYLARPLDESQSCILAEKESDDMRWFSRKDIECLDERTEIFGNVKHYILSLLKEEKKHLCSRYDPHSSHKNTYL